MPPAKKSTPQSIIDYSSWNNWLTGSAFEFSLEGQKKQDFSGKRFAFCPWPYNQLDVKLIYERETSQTNFILSTSYLQCMKSNNVSQFFEFPSQKDIQDYEVQARLECRFRAFYPMTLNGREHDFLSNI